MPNCSLILRNYAKTKNDALKSRSNSRLGKLIWRSILFNKRKRNFNDETPLQTTFGVSFYPSQAGPKI